VAGAARIDRRSRFFGADRDRADGYLRGTTTLVTDGVFGHTRNPLYVGVSVALCGIALIFDLDWVILLIVPSCVFLHFAVVRREERYLERKFGDAYRLYKERVPRYFAGN
jgi:protein-S-isoprenylcysteine O-methyltransferase Ste14